MSTVASQYTFDAVEAKRACDFFEECLVHVKGHLAGKPFALESWQRELIGDVFGWRDEHGRRKHRIAYVEVPRKNGKTTLAAGVALYLLIADGEEGAEIYTAASTRDQASLAFNVAAEMVRKSPFLSKHLKVRDSQKRIVYERRASFLRAIAAEAGAAHGYNAHGIVFDEVHAQPDRELWDVLNTSTGARMQPLTFAITTAGHDRSSICWELHQYALGVAAGDIDDPTFYPAVFAADRDAAMDDPAAWAQANPSLGVSLRAEWLAQECERAKNTPSYENTFRRLHLNQWTEQDVRWLPMATWDECAGPLPWADMAAALEGRECVAALDLASTRDVNSLVLTFALDGQYAVLPYFWIPAESHDTRAEQDRRQLLNWAAQGLIRTTPGNTTDYKSIAADVMEIAKQFDVTELTYDPWGPAQAFAQVLQDEGFPLARLSQFRQSLANFAAPTKEFERLVISHKLAHGGHPVLRWMASNVTVKEDVSGNIRPDKGRSADKIDGVVASIMGLGVLMARMEEPQGPSVYETREALWIGD